MDWRLVVRRAVQQPHKPETRVFNRTPPAKRIMVVHVSEYAVFKEVQKEPSSLFLASQRRLILTVPESQEGTSLDLDEWRLHPSPQRGCRGYLLALHDSSRQLDSIHCSTRFRCCEIKALAVDAFGRRRSGGGPPALRASPRRRAEVVAAGGAEANACPSSGACASDDQRDGGDRRGQGDQRPVRQRDERGTLRVPGVQDHLVPAPLG